MAFDRPRLRDVAARAGVSEKTVSNVINDYPHVTESTRGKVEVALRDLNYRVNASARSLAGGRTGFIALAVPSLDNPYFSQLAAHVMPAAAKHRWTVLIEQTGGSADGERQVTGGTMPNLVDGVILHLRSLTPADLMNRDDDTPLVLIGERTSDPLADYVAGDSIAASYELTRHLLETGRTRIAAIGLERDTAYSASSLRFEGYRAALAEAGLYPVPELMIPGARHNREHGAAAAATLLKLPELPDAVVCFNDLLALGALSQFNLSGVDVPGDIAVVGFDDIDEAAYSHPPLTSVGWDTRAIAEQAVALLVARVEGDRDSPPRESAVGYRLAVRSSSG